MNNTHTNWYKIKCLIKAMRIRTALLSTLLLIASFRLIDWTGFKITYIVFIFLLTSLTMVNNNWEDREIDRCKSETFASDNKNLYLTFLNILLVLTIVVWMTAFWDNLPVLLYTGILMVVALSYSRFRKVPFIPFLYVGVTSGMGMLMAQFFKFDFRILILAVATIFTISGREIIKDLEDCDWDKGKKWTFPVVFGKDLSAIIVAILYSFGMISFYLLDFVMPVILLIFSFLIFYYVDKGKYKTSKLVSDLLIFFALISILI